MSTHLSREIAKLRKAKKLTQQEVANRLNLPRATYAKKESDGAFGPDEIPGLIKIIGGDREKLIALAHQSDTLNVDNWKEYLIKGSIMSNAMQRVILSTLAEVLAKQRGESVTKVMAELAAAVEAEKSMNSIR